MTLDVRVRAGMLAAALGAAGAAAQERPQAPAVTLDPVVVTVTRVEERGLDR
ncbi:MAG: hypothetical protein M5U08_22235 [Burkholderiales bacterium]|nr:hypothetical protein [Burkholderiales bacterium]